MSIEQEAWSELPSCNVCLGSTDPDYLAYNIAVSGVVLAVVGLIGLVGNVLVVIVYISPEQRVHSTSIYLAALAVSDFSMITTAMFLFVLEAWRHHGPPILAYAYGLGAPLIFPLGAVFQTTSVYFCVAVAVDCFIGVVLPRACKVICCTARLAFTGRFFAKFMRRRNAKIVVVTLAVLCFLYNIPHFFEIRAIECLQEKRGIGHQHGSATTANGSVMAVESYRSLQICPTDIRLDALYYTVYYTYMYTTFMAVGPLLLLIVLNIFVVYAVIRRGAASEDSDTVSLILVVCLFIFCNFTALVVNFLELTLYDKLKHIIVYLVDMSNLLVIINATANFFVYLIFGESFRRSLMSIFGGKSDQKGAAVAKGTTAASNLIWAEETSRRLSSKSSSGSSSRSPVLRSKHQRQQQQQQRNNGDDKCGTHGGGGVVVTTEEDDETSTMMTVNGSTATTTRQAEANNRHTRR